MLEISVLLSSFIANLITKFIKPNKLGLLSVEDAAARKTFIRLMNASFGVLSLVTTSWLLGEPLDISSLQDGLQTIFAVIVTFATSQGVFFLAKK